MKFISKLGKSDKELKSLKREIEILRNMHHENIIEMLDSFDTDKEVILYMIIYYIFESKIIIYS